MGCLHSILGWWTLLIGLGAHFYSCYMASTVHTFWLFVTFPLVIVGDAFWYIYFLCTGTGSECTEYCWTCGIFFVSLALYLGGFALPKKTYRR